MNIEIDHGTLLIAGKYQMEELLGVGAMSLVYRGTDCRNSQPVAIKIMKKALLEDAEVYARFSRELRTTKNLRHENIVEVYEGGSLSTGEPFFVMELIEGDCLAEILRQQKTMPIARALNIVAQAADALAFAHKRGYVHRDIKPQNLMIIHGLTKDTVKILDFGIAKLSESLQRFETFATKPGEVLGTPLYMSPEQILGQPIDGRSDIYSLGCVLYKSLCGQLPIQGDNAIAIMQNHLNEIPPHLNYYSKTKLPEDLNALVQKALAKMPEDRYQDMNEFAEALREFASPHLLGKLISLIQPKLINPQFKKKVAK